MGGRALEGGEGRVVSHKSQCINFQACFAFIYYLAKNVVSGQVSGYQKQMLLRWVG